MDEIKIRVSQEAQGTALDDAKKDLKELKAEAAKPTPAAPIAPAAAAPATPASTAERVAKLRAEAAQQRQFAERSAEKFGFHDVTAKSARASAAALESEARRLERPENQAAKAAQKQERDARAAALREERAMERQADGERRSADRQAAAEKKAAQAELARAERAAGSEQVRREKEIAQEQRQRASTEKARAAWLRRAGVVAGGAAMAGAGLVANDVFEGRGVEIGDRMKRASDERDFALRQRYGYTAAQATGDTQATEDRIFSGEQNRENLKNSQLKKTVLAILGGMGGGAMTGSFVGGPVGAAGGALIGGAGAGIAAWRSGGHAQQANEKAIAADRELLVKQEAERRKLVTAEIEASISAQEKANRGEMQSARRIEDQVTWLRVKKQVLAETKGDEAMATRAADAEIARIQKSRAGQFGRFVSSSTSAAASARIATMAAQYSEGGERDGRTGELIQVVKAQHQEATNAWRFRDFTRR